MYVNGNPVMGTDPTGHFAWREDDPHLGILVRTVHRFNNLLHARGFITEAERGAIHVLNDVNDNKQKSVLESAKPINFKKYGILGPTNGTKYVTEVRPGEYAALADEDKMLYRGYSGIKKENMEKIINDSFKNGLTANPNKSSINEESVFDDDGKIKENAYGRNFFTTSGISTTHDFDGTAKYFGESCVFKIDPKNLIGFDFMGMNVRQEVNIIHDIPEQNICGVYVRKNLLPESFTNQIAEEKDDYFYIENNHLLFNN